MGAAIILEQTEHRQYPLPAGRWVMRQTWRDLLFAHWPMPPEVIRATLPPGLPLDTYGGQAWLSIVPFVMSDVRPRGLPPVPGVSTFAELNLRTYVTRDGRPGVFFYSLDAASPIAVAVARRFFFLPYFNARARIRREGEAFSFASVRGAQHGVPSGEFAARYRPDGPVAIAAPGSLDDWLTARYCFYTSDTHGGLYRCEIQHAPWPLQPAEAEIERNTIPAVGDFTLPPIPPRLQFSASQEILAWPLQRISALA